MLNDHQTPEWLWPVGVIVVISLVRLTVAAGMPVTQDEAYYFDWARTLQWGYFDHPPAVALLGVGTLLERGSALAARLGTWIAGTLTLLVLWRLFRQCGLRDAKGHLGSLTLALTIAAASLSGFGSGVITTPDTALALCWVLALHEGLAALSGRRRRWISTGLAVGLGLLSKYTMLVIGPVFLWAILLADPAALRSRWPYLGALLALLVFAPNLLWNANNDWLTLRFQFGHGFSTETGALALAADGLSASAAIPLAPVEPLTLADRLDSLASFFGSQLALFGLMVIPLLAGVIGRLRTAWRRQQRDQAAVAEVDVLVKPARALLVASGFFPLLLFAWVATFSEVEPNWPAMSVPALAALLAVWVRPRPKWMLTAAAGNLLLIGLYTWHAATVALPLGDKLNRILRESHGYSALAERVTQLDGPVIADRYQIAAMLNFYQQLKSVSQWPGLTRASEYSRGVIAPLPRRQDSKSSGFWLVSARPDLVEISGFRAVTTWQEVDCAGKPLHELDLGAAEAICPHPLHVWRVTHYQLHQQESPD